MCIRDRTDGYPAIFVWGNNASQKATLVCDEKTNILKGELVKGNEHCEITPGKLQVVDKTQTHSTK